VQYNETMSKWLAVVVFVTVGAGCNYGASAFNCTMDEQCQGAGHTDGKCESTNLCSFPDTRCGADGRSYGDLSGNKAGQCVGDQVDGGGGGIDASTAPVCFGTGLLRICLPATPTDALTIPVLTVIDTDTSSMCARVTSGGNYCVLAGTSITISAKLRAGGARPLVLLATGAITSTTNGVIDVGSHNGASPETGAGADPAACVAGVAGGTSAGGAGGSFLGKGGDGGRGGGMNGGGGGGAAAAVTVTSVTELRGGCAGQDGDGNGVATAKGLQGHGGGAVFLIAGTKIDLQGGVNATGEGGGPGVTGSAGGGGGGAGGMIGLDAPMITSSGSILASGGGGGEGSGLTSLGDGGSDPTTTMPARGGKGSSTIGGDGGDGSANTVAATGASGNPGSMAMGGGGGGGGGGAGLIKAPATATLGTQLSPPATP